jgi:hypothetical protein
MTQREPTLEADAKASAGNDGGVDARELTELVQDSFKGGIDDLKVGGHVEPLRDRDVVVHLDRVLVLQTEIELLPQKRQERVAELSACEGKAEAVVRTPRDDALTADPAEKEYSIGLGFPSEAPNPKKRPIPCFGLPSGCQKY